MSSACWQVDEAAAAGPSGVNTAPAPLVVVTRPQRAGRDLAAALRAQGSDALWCPAFDILAAADPALLRDTLARLDAYDIVVFVSPSAVEAFAGAWAPDRETWPHHAAIAAMGAATRAAVLARIPGAARAVLLCPEGALAADGGSEALWPLLQRHEPAARRALIVRAQGGRQWLSDQLAGAGVQVEELAAYRRLAHAPTVSESAALHAAAAAGKRLAILYSSAEAIEVVARQLAADTALARALASAIGLGVHQRIVELLRARGGTDVRLCAPDPAAVRRALR